MRNHVITLAALAMLVTWNAGAAGAQRADCSKMNDSTIDHNTMDHSAHHAMLAECGGSGALPTLPGQAAFGVISEVVRILEADPKTDWAKVDIEALRQHLIDMDEVTMRAAVVPRNVPGGVELTVSGTGRTADAIRRMAANHTRMLGQGGDYDAVARETDRGAVVTVTAKNRGDARTVARIRGLGFAGLLTEGDHHAAHHLALARGDAAVHQR